MKAGRGPTQRMGRGIPLNMKSPIYEVEDPDTDKAAAEARALAEAKRLQSEAGANKGNSSNVRDFSGESSYRQKGKKVERLAETPEEIAAWKAASEESKNKYRDKTIDVTQNVSDIGKDPVPRKEEPVVELPKPKGYFNYGSNMHNMNFGGHTSYGSTSKEMKPPSSYANSPENPISGRPNEFKQRPMTDREYAVSQSRFGDNTSPYNTTPEEWEAYLTNAEKGMAAQNAKANAKNLIMASRRSEAQAAKEKRDAAKLAKRTAYNESRRRK
tara:strand:+ start:1015 stop:1827 length:813 start_codon:yes stop_codon:yes gene_type:complete